ncbi:MAG: 2-amino-4-hydroxy-6-hydroxymethyldihydropteridine diphosphokinase [Bacteroidales bacterium]|nr:2-amino-4-hydroxy-6-hydroxymethyldihydropteridine diphosphokinase [Bacteroidales bacterium]
MSIAYLLTGSNLGQRQENLCLAVSALNGNAGKVQALSAIYESPPWGFEHPNAFLNQAIRLDTTLSPQELLKVILRTETLLGRQRDHNGYAARTIDIDILFYDNIIRTDKTLSIPHPRLHERRFALTPLADIAAGLIHPVIKKTVKELLDYCTDNSKISIFTAAPLAAMPLTEDCNAV